MNMMPFSAPSGALLEKYSYLLLGFLVVTALSIAGNRIKAGLEPENDDQELIRRYLLDGGGGEGGSSLDMSVSRKPKLWIHTKYQKNARMWKSFQSRTSDDLNQPYLNLTVETVVNHCGDDFQICLIDDESFSSLLPDWGKEKGDLSRTPDPQKTHLRQEGLLRLLIRYGGIVVPNSFVSFQNLITLYQAMMISKKPFLAENVNHATNPASSRDPAPYFAPSMFFMGALKGDPVLEEMVQSLVHFHAHDRCDMMWSRWCLYKIHVEEKIDLIDGEQVGVKTRRGLPVTIESFFEEAYLQLGDHHHHDPAAAAGAAAIKPFYGIFLPADEILARTKYQWFAVLSKEEIYACNAIIAKYILASLVETNDEYLRLERKRNRGRAIGSAI